MPRRQGLPLWKLLCDLSPKEVVELVDFRYLSDVLPADEALELLSRASGGNQTVNGGCWLRATPPITLQPAGWAIRTKKYCCSSRLLWPRGSPI